MNNKIVYVIVGVGIAVTSCLIGMVLGPSGETAELSPEATAEERIVEVTVEVTVEVPQTEMVTVEVPVTVTYTPGPSPTPTITNTPTPSSTPTPTATPFNVGGCSNLRSVANYWNLKSDQYEDRLYPYYDGLDGSCVKLFVGDDVGVVGTDYSWISKTQGLDFTFIFDDMSPEGFTGFTNYSTVWGIFQRNQSGDYDILVRRVEPFGMMQQPIVNDGFYMVGTDYDLGEGQWKSLWPPGMVDNCYYARTNPDTGRIKDNHFGQAGIYTRLYASDMFESRNCAPWIFIGQ